MTRDEMQAKVELMQAKLRVAARGHSLVIWQNPDGSYSHHKDSQRKWTSFDACQMDLRFHGEWERAAQ